MKTICAGKEHATDLAYLINLAGEGIPAYLWRELAKENESPLEVGAMRAARENGSFNYLNAKVCVEKGAVCGMIVSYRQPDPYDLSSIEDYPEIVQPMVKLEAEVPGSWYINALATYEAHRGKGIASGLIADAEKQALGAQCNMMSIIVASENIRAKKLYTHLGFKVISKLPVVLYPGCLHGGEWQLMTNDIGSIVY